MLYELLQLTQADFALLFLLQQLMKKIGAAEIILTASVLSSYQTTLAWTQCKARWIIA